MGCFSCFDGTQKQQRKEEERQASAEARARAAEAAMRRFFSLFSHLFFRFRIASIEIDSFGSIILNLLNPFRKFISLNESEISMDYWGESS